LGTLKAIIIISGFTQKNYQDTGSKELWIKMHLCEDLCAEPNVLIELKEWDSDWKSYAKYINSMKPSEVLVCAYSWGGGHGMPQLCKRLVAPVTCVLCDPVFHSKTLVGRWMAFLDWKIKVPKNVTVVKHFIQEARWNELDGDPLKGGKSICNATVLDYTHTEIDNSPEYHKAAITTARQFLGK
jgi:hypothetical protein